MPWPEAKVVEVCAHSSGMHPKEFGFLSKVRVASPALCNGFDHPTCLVAYLGEGTGTSMREYLSSRKWAIRQPGKSTNHHHVRLVRALEN
jgi:hypothetical protein